MLILILQLKRIGDAILTTPLLAALREHVPGCEITLALDAPAAGLAPALDADHLLVRGKNFWPQIARTPFDVVLDLTGTDRSALATALAGTLAIPPRRAPRRITWTRFAKKPLRRAIYTEFVNSSVKTRHTADHHTDLLAPLGINVENVPSTLRPPPAAQAEADAALAAAGINGPFAIVHPGTARPEKYWEPARWATVIAHLQRRHDLPVLLTGSNAPAERAHLVAIQISNLAPQTSNLHDLAGQLTLLGTAALISRARVLCAVDSAPVHLADALGTPVVALFGPTNPFHWRPRRATARVITPPGGDKGPMDRIETPVILDAIDRLLAP